MSTILKKGISCPSCGAYEELNVFSGMNLKDNPEFKEMVLSETIFDWECDKCGYFAEMSYPTVYHDPSKGYILALYRTSTKGEDIVVPQNLFPLIKRRVKNLSELKEKILILDSELNDFAVEVTKFVFMPSVKKSIGNENVNLYFSKVLEDGSLEFAVFESEDSEPSYHTASKAVYDQALEVVRTLNVSETHQFLRVNKSIAENLMASYKKI